MDKKAALIATAIIAGIALVCLLCWLAIYGGYRWAQVTLAVLFAVVLWRGFYWAFKD